MSIVIYNNVFILKKVNCQYTGPDRLTHDNKVEITRGMVKDAKENHIFLPSILGLGKILLKTIKAGMTETGL